MAEIELYAATLARLEGDRKSTKSQSGASKSVRFGEASVMNSEGGQTQMTAASKKELLKR